VQLVSREDILRKVAYVAANPVQDQLVDRVDHWPGVNGYRALLSRRLLEAARPLHFFRKDGPMPAHVSIQLSFPDELGDPEALSAELEAMVGDIERNAAKERARTGGRILGRAAVLKQSWRSAPTTFEMRRQMSPRVAARNMWARIEALVRNKAFARAYAGARSRWLEGEDAVFPAGTYWLRRFAGVTVAAA
jgi:hypothetical protein